MITIIRIKAMTTIAIVITIIIVVIRSSNNRNRNCINKTTNILSWQLINNKTYHTDSGDLERMFLNFEGIVSTFIIS